MPMLFKPLFLTLALLACFSGAARAATTGTGLTFSGNLVAGCEYSVSTVGGMIDFSGWRPSDFSGIGSVLTSRAQLIPVTVRCPGSSYMRVTTVGTADSNDPQALVNQGTAMGLGMIIYDATTNFMFTPNDPIGETLLVPSSGTFDVYVALKQTATTVTRGSFSSDGTVIVIAVP
ncbi:fimbrial protein [Serratia quinivorans]|uniref:fimbrial protein n=1 Tax=Serratia quinivorans TaxID=137545 RepID=UPI00217C7621|nr:fimbrial protein [Serratia quinivorans]CAI1073052.1 P pilus assembly protein, pilin FimA [Serratia quinivorans]